MRLIGGAGALGFNPELGLAAGGFIKQYIQKDPYPADSWDRDSTTLFNVQILSASLFEQITGYKAPECPINAATYLNYGLPFFDINEQSSTIRGAFSKLKSLSSLHLVNLDPTIRTESKTCEFKPVSTNVRESRWSRLTGKQRVEPESAQTSVTGTAQYEQHAENDDDDDDVVQQLEGLGFEESKAEVWNKLYFTGLRKR
jgi:hypothetical protein